MIVRPQSTILLSHKKDPAPVGDVANKSSGQCFFNILVHSFTFRQRQREDPSTGRTGAREYLRDRFDSDTAFLAARLHNGHELHTAAYVTDGGW
ncbi:hypothetical protein AALO_G00109510 [Alosa alosa]|uniref:Uncharacterized protein n=1 Tax=Alosa alosa TaxID=278164 RepID=A0AAV6GS39_9TELE|nr:hypothetical protein AALO_G00109510 [Alosa alosa]